MNPFFKYLSLFVSLSFLASCNDTYRLNCDDHEIALQRASSKGDTTAMEQLTTPSDFLALRFLRRLFGHKLVDNIDANCSRHDSALINAIKAGHLHAVRFLLRKGADPNIQQEDGSTALMSAISKGNINIARLLINHGADPNIQQKEGFTALMLAVSKGSIYLTRLLINHGADPNIQQKEGFTALMLATSQGSVDAVKLLLTKQANLSLKSVYDKKVLSYARGPLKELSQALGKEEKLLISSRRMRIPRSLFNSKIDKAETIKKVNDYKEIIRLIKKEQRNRIYRQGKTAMKQLVKTALQETAILSFDIYNYEDGTSGIKVRLNIPIIRTVLVVLAL